MASSSSIDCLVCTMAGYDDDDDGDVDVDGYDDDDGCDDDGDDAWSRDDQQWRAVWVEGDWGSGPIRLTS